MTLGWYYENIEVHLSEECKRYDGDRVSKKLSCFCLQVIPSEAYSVGSPRTSLCWNCEQSMEARDRVGIWLSYQLARLHRLAESIPLGIDCLAPEKFKNTVSAFRKRSRLLVHQIGPAEGGMYTCQVGVMKYICQVERS